MSITIVRSITCDVCGDWVGHIDLATAATLRGQAKKRGWKVALPGGKDLCPNCPDVTAAPDTAGGEQCG